VAEVVVVGAGPQGLAVAGSLRRAQVETVVVGEVMGFWRRHMPKGMWLRSSKRSSSIADPTKTRTLARFEQEVGLLPEPLPIERFIDYAEWYQAHEVPTVSSARVTSIERANGGFRLRTKDGDELSAKRVVVAAGMAPFAWRPPEFDQLPTELASHPFDHTDFASFAGKRALVVGAGQSALESAALLREAGALVEIIARAPRITWIAPPVPDASPLRRLYDRLTLAPTDVGSRGTSWIAATPDIWRRLPSGMRKEIAYEVIQPMGGYWLPSRLNGVAIHTSRRVVAASPSNGGLEVQVDDGSRREVDHLLFATGYRVDLSKYDFLAPDLLSEVQRVAGYPKLTAGFESSIPGLHFIGAPAAASFGPVMRFVTGSWYAAQAVTRRVLDQAPRPVSVSF
jgi:FAD-dependent urate hydroxylase